MSADLPPEQTQEPPSDRLAPIADLVHEREVRELAGLLARVVELAERSSIYPGDWEDIAELAIRHHSVCAALERNGPSRS
jgi:hypothetical protein